MPEERQALELAISAKLIAATPRHALVGDRMLLAVLATSLDQCLGRKGEAA